MHITIIILNWNGKKDTLECLSSLQQLTYPHFDVLLVDNGSTDDSVSAIRSQFPNIPLLETGENLGFAEGNNVGIRYALKTKTDAILLLNNDTTVDPHLLEGFSTCSAQHPECGVLGAKIYLYAEPGRLDHLGGIWNKKTGKFDLIALRKTDQEHIPVPLDYVCGCALFAKREVFETIGLLEPKFFLIWEESDFCFRARRHGYQIKTAEQAKLWHKVSASFVGGKPHSTYFWWRNRLLWIERNCSIREQISLYLRVLIPEIFHLYKLKILKSLQVALQPTVHVTERKQKIALYKAALGGVKDYVLRRFGNGPTWIYKRE